MIYKWSVIKKGITLGYLSVHKIMSFLEFMLIFNLGILDFDDLTFIFSMYSKDVRKPWKNYNFLAIVNILPFFRTNKIYESLLY